MQIKLDMSSIIRHFLHNTEGPHYLAILLFANFVSMLFWIVSEKTRFTLFLSCCLPAASQLPPSCLPATSKRPPSCLLGASQVPSRCLPGASQVPPRCLPGASQVPPRCLPGASQRPPSCLPAASHLTWHLSYVFSGHSDSVEGGLTVITQKID
jgi:hypothetical protein